ncbi:PH domain-containing protein [Haloquadratum walsbyi]|nr:PH domain-containing protein [Haloquadratum walsbyi]
MILRYNSRKAPIDELRGFEYSQDSIQTLLGYGSIRLLTGGTNQSLGFLVFENLPNAGKARNHIEDLIQ